MTNTVPRAAVNQQAQLGVESTAGTAVSAGKLLTAFTWTMGLKPTTKQFRGTGRQYPSASAMLKEMSAGKITGPGDFAQLVYPVSSLWGAATISAHGSSTTAYDWLWTPPLTGSYAKSAKTYTVQVGDSTDAEQYAYTVFTGWGYTFTRTTEMQVTGDLIAQTFTDGVTLTASPTEIEQLPMTGAQFNLYLDSTSSGIGGTQLTDPLKVEFKASDYYDGYWPVNRSNASYTSILDKEKKNELTILLEANSTGIAVKGNYLETGDKCYIRVDGQGPTIDGTNSVKAAMQHDMVCLVTNMAEFSIEEEVYAVSYTLAVSEDTAWGTSGTAQKLTLTNLLSAL